MKPHQKIEQIINYNLFNEIPNKWKTSKLYFTFKENGMKLPNADSFATRVSHFFESRNRLNERDLFKEQFNIKLTSDLKRECALHFGDIETHPKKLKSVARELMHFLIQLWPDIAAFIDEELISESLKTMYQIPYYEKTSQFSFARFKAKFLRSAKKKMREALVKETTMKLDSIDPELIELNTEQHKPIPSLASSSHLDNEVDSVSDFHSLTQAELNWLQELSEIAMKPEFSAFPKIRGTAVKSDSEYPEAIRSLLKTTREYDLRVSKSKSVSMELKLRIQDGIRSIAREILERYERQFHDQAS